MDAPAVAFGILCLAVGILLHKKRSKLGKLNGLVLSRLISLLMLFGGTGLAGTFIGDWLQGMDFSIGGVTSTQIVIILAIVLGIAVAIDVFDGNGLRPSTYAMIALFPILYTAGGGSLDWVRTTSAAAWSAIAG